MLAKINISHNITGEPKEKFSLMRFSGADCDKSQFMFDAKETEALVL